MAAKTKSVSIRLLEERVQALEAELEEKDSALEDANDRLTQIYALTSDLEDEDDGDEDYDEDDEDDEEEDEEEEIEGEVE